jgi:hypothetical protein
VESLLAHTSTCPACHREARALDGLARRLRGAPPVDDVTVRRVRHRVLERADRSLRTPQVAYHPFVLAFGLAAAAVVFVAWVVRSSPRESPRAEAITVNPAPFAAFARKREGGVDIVELRDGSVRFTVRHAAETPQLIVRVPDGEIEDVGTVFTVTVSRGHTDRIDVAEGLVAFHRRPGGDALVRAGMPFVRQSTEAAPPASSSAESAPAPRPRTDTGARHATRLAKPRAPTADERALDAERDAEDDAYLNVVRLLRDGRREEAERAATAYLDRFPQGFRRPEVERALRGRAPR